LVQTAGGTVAGLGFLIELEELAGRKKLAPFPLKALIRY
jgi:adenine phosphoribosyltransferase